VYSDRSNPPLLALKRRNQEIEGEGSFSDLTTALGTYIERGRESQGRVSIMRQGRPAVRKKKERGGGMTPLNEFVGLFGRKPRAMGGGESYNF